MSLSAEAAVSTDAATDAASVRAQALAARPYRWVVLAVAFAAFLVTFLDRLAWANANLFAGKSLVAVIFGAAAAVSKPLYGLLSDLLGGKRRNLVIYDLLAFSAMLMVFGQMDSRIGFILAAPFLGLTAVVYSPLLAAMITERVEPSLVATATGMINALWQLGSVIVPSVVGIVFAATGSFQSAFAILAAGPLVATFCMLAVREQS